MIDAQRVADLLQMAQALPCRCSIASQSASEIP
jgi:hypothetical protein